MGPITDAHKLTYNQNVALAVQQKKSRFEMGFTYASGLKGRQSQILELFGPSEAIIDGARGGDTPNIDNGIEPVWVRPRQIEWGHLIEKEDAIKALTDYQSFFVQSGAAAIVRGRDRVFAASLFADRIIGQDGGQTQAWQSTGRYVDPTIGSVDGVSATGMNVKKIQRAKRLLRAQYVDLDMEELWGILNAQEMEELYNDILSTVTEDRKYARLDDDKKMVMHFAGVNFVHYEGMSDIDASTYGSAIWCKSGMYYGDFDPLTTQVQPNPAKKYRPHPYMENWWGASRTEDAKLIRLGTKK